MKCPKCSSTELRKSRHGEWTDILHKLLGQQAYRCRACRTRFHTSESPDTPARVSKSVGSKKHHHKGPHASRRMRRRLIEAAVFVAMLIIFLVFLRYLTREQPPASTPESGSAAITLAS